MAPSSYKPLDPMKRSKGIVRPGARHLVLPLVDRHARTVDEFEENLLTSTSSKSFSALPTSASMYSQDSYTFTPAVFKEDMIDRRRFAIVATPAHDGPWNRPARLRSAASNVFVLDLHSATVDGNPFIADDEEQKDEAEDVKVHEVEKRGILVDTPLEPVSESVSPVKKMAEKFEPKALVAEVDSPSKEATKKRMKKVRMSTRVIGRMMSRLSIHQSSSRTAGTDQQPLLPLPPPQISVALPSPGLAISTSSKIVQDSKVNQHDCTPEKSVEIRRTSSLIRTTWKTRLSQTPGNETTESEQDSATSIPADSAAISRSHQSMTPALKHTSVPEGTKGTNGPSSPLSSQNRVDIPRNRATLPPTWQPHRPPSPNPVVLRKRGKHTRNAASLSDIKPSSPPPPVPPRRNWMLPPPLESLESSKTTYQSFSVSLDSATSPDRDSPRWSDIQMRLRARAMKSSTYAIHNGGVISPTGSQA